MYLVDFQLRELCEKHGLVEPFDPARVNPASIDLALGRDFVNLSDKSIRYKNSNFEGGYSALFADSGERFVADRVWLEPGVALLATTAEKVRIPDKPFFWANDTFGNHQIKSCVAELRLKSSAARNGLDHALAGWIDPGFDGTLTLELHAHRPVELLAGKAYVQMVVAVTLATPTRSYQQTGRYVGESAQGAVLAKD